MGDAAVTFNHFLRKYSAVYGKWTTKPEGKVNDLREINGSILQFQTFIHH